MVMVKRQACGPALCPAVHSRSFERSLKMWLILTPDDFGRRLWAGGAKHERYIHHQCGDMCQQPVSKQGDKVRER